MNWLSPGARLRHGDVAVLVDDNSPVIVVA